MTLSYIWRYDILWSEPFNFVTEVQYEKMKVKVYILHWHQCRKILRIHHLMHKTIINQHQNGSVASIVSKDYKNTKTSNLTFWQYFCLWNVNDLYLKIVPCDLFRVLLEQVTFVTKKITNLHHRVEGKLSYWLSNTFKPTSFHYRSQKLRSFLWNDSRVVSQHPSGKSMVAFGCIFCDK